MEMEPYKFANLTDSEEVRIKQLEEDLHVVLIAYDKEGKQVKR
jgi:hypothetical protein